MIQIHIFWKEMTQVIQHPHLIFLAFCRPCFRYGWILFIVEKLFLTIESHWTNKKKWFCLHMTVRFKWCLAYLVFHCLSRIIKKQKWLLKISLPSSLLFFWTSFSCNSSMVVWLLKRTEKQFIIRLERSSTLSKLKSCDILYLCSNAW